MKSQHKPSLAAGILLCVVLFLAGCAVLTVDVDVYKGPLSNNDEVQVEQLRVMANAAKPLLTAARNRLEGEKLIQCYTNYNAAFMRQPTNICRGSNWFTNANAEQLNMVLSLYEDLVPPREAKLLAQLRVLIQEYARAYEILNPSPSRLIHQAATAAELQSLGDSPLHPTLRQEVVAFLKEPFKNPSNIVLSFSERDLTNALKHAFPRADAGAMTNVAGRFGVSAMFRWLENPEFRRQVVARAIASEGSLTNSTVSTNRIAADLEVSLNEIAAAFRDAREALSEIFLVGLELVKELHDNRHDDAYCAERFRAAVEFVVDLINGDRLVDFLGSKLWMENRESSLDALLRNFVPSSVSVIGSASDRQIITAVREALLQNPIQTADGLSVVHNLLIRKSDDLVHFQVGQLDQFGTRLARGGGLYGIVKGPVLLQHLSGRADADDAPEPQILDQKVEALAGAGGWERGRSLRGLDSLVEEYLRHAEARNKADQERAAEDLCRELLYFSQKILFLANNARLVDGNGVAKTQVRLLQSIGNSIQTQVNEYYSRKQHSLQQVASRPYHVESYQKARLQNPTEALDRLIQSAKQKVNAANEAAIAKAKADLAQSKAQLDTATNAFHAASVNYTNALKRRDQLILEATHWMAISGLFNTASNSAPADVAEANVVQGVIRDLEAAATNLVYTNEPAQIQLIRLQLAPNANIASEPRDTVFGRLETRISGSKAAGLAALSAIRVQEESLQASVLSTSNALAPAQEGFDLKTKELAEAQESANRNNKAIDELSSLRFRLLPRLETLADQKTPNAAIGLLIGEIKASLETETTKTNEALKLVLSVALKEAQSWPRPGPTDVLTAVENLSTNAVSSEVWSALIAELEFQQVDALRNGHTATAAAIEEALRGAREHRSGLTYLRPAAAFLRNSYAVSELQQSRVAWKNMLSHHARRSLPFASSRRENNPSPEDLRIIEQIDNQFWQNINRVRVAGGGDSNYVLAKDDTGNWYIKQYSVDVKQVVQSMKNIALFGAGPAVGASGAFSLATATNAASAPPKSAYRTQYDLFTTNYLNDTKALYLDLKTNLAPAKVREKVTTAWNNVDASLTAILDRATNALVTLSDYPASPKTAADNLVKLAGGLNAFYLSLTNGLSNNHPAQVTAAKKVVDDAFKDVQNRRESILQSYESALKVIGTTVSN
jgi:hypothetical protein